MTGYLIAEEGPLSGLILRFEEGDEWVLGRDPDVSSIVLEDPMVSRRHIICRLTPEGYVIENLSSVNPATQNGKVITEPVLLREGDIIQIGSTFFRFSKEASIEEQSDQQPPLEEAELPSPALFEEQEDLSAISLDVSAEARWFLKVISGPNTGAEFGMKRGATYLLGKDPNLCDIIFQDLSVSRQHARITIDENDFVSIEDLGSRNGVIVNGELITTTHPIASQDLIALGTTSFLIIDREQVRETIFAPPSFIAQKVEPEIPSAAPSLEVQEEEIAAQEAPVRDWKEMVIPQKHLVIGGLFAALIFLAVVAMFSLFKTRPVVVQGKNSTEQIQEALKNFSDIQFSFNQNNGKLFLVGHVITPVDKQELLYLTNNLPFVESIDDNVVIDEYVWQNMNALLITNPDWQGVSVYAPSPGHFLLKGYLQTLEQAQSLADYVNMNFPYLDRLDNQVVIESNLSTQIQSILIEKGFNGVTFQLSNGELVLSGRADTAHMDAFNTVVNEFKGLSGIRLVKNFVVMATADTSRVDLSPQYRVTGFSKKDDVGMFYVVINGKILSKGDTLDGMVITGVQPDMILLEKDGLKFKINYNLQ